MDSVLVNQRLLFYSSGIVPFVTTPSKVRFVVFLQWPLIGYFRLGKVIAS